MTFDPSFMSSCTSFLTYCSALQYLEHASKCLTDFSIEESFEALIYPEADISEHFQAACKSACCPMLLESECFL